MIAAFLAGVPVRVYTIHGLPFVTSRGLRRLILTATERVACALASQVLCVSESVREVAVANAICSPRRIKVLGSGSANGVDAQSRFNPNRISSQERERTREKLGIPPDAVVAGFVGRLVGEKGLRELVSAWHLLRAELPNLRLLVIGPHDVNDALDASTVRELESDPRICMAGAQWDTPPFFAAMDVLCLPSYREGFPTVLLEAAAMGIPAVATEIPGCVDAVEDGVTGRLVPARDPSALAQALRSYVLSAGLRQQHGRAARDRALKSFQVEVIQQAQLEEYSRLLTLNTGTATTALVVQPEHLR